MTRTKSSREYVLKVCLKVRRRVSRKLAFRGDQTLDDVHEAIFRAFDRFDPHLYTFYFPKMTSRRKAGQSAVTEYAPPFMLEDPGPFPSPRLFDATKARLDGIGLCVGQRFEYLFDFGDAWLHEVDVQAVGSVQPGRKYPTVLERKGDSPPQYDADSNEDAATGEEAG